MGLVTCKLVFPEGTSRQKVEELLSKHSGECVVINFYDDAEMGCNKVAYAVVDVPEAIVHDLYNESLVRHVDLMTTYGKRPTKDCGGGCGCRHS